MSSEAITYLLMTVANMSLFLVFFMCLIVVYKDNEFSCSHKIIDKFFQKKFFLRCSVGNNYCRFVIVSRQFTDFPAMGFKLFGNWNIKDIKKPIILIYN